ncbi:hypothetical protein B0H14DRAFT_3134916 [Mycena olivaceomarginata]|nr:hypothetical protein B0H14DRAFT_3134916 [Mycena olivaceomarginata]
MPATSTQAFHDGKLVLGGFELSDKPVAMSRSTTRRVCPLSLIARGQQAQKLGFPLKGERLLGLRLEHHLESKRAESAMTPQLQREEPTGSRRCAKSAGCHACAQAHIVGYERPPTRRRPSPGRGGTSRAGPARRDGVESERTELARTPNRARRVRARLDSGSAWAITNAALRHRHRC